MALNQTRLARFDADQELAAARIRLALVNRADLRAALAEYEASQPALQLEIARQHPDIHLGPGYERDQSDNKWKLGLSFELPRWNRHEGPIAEAEATRAECARFSTRSSARP